MSAPYRADHVGSLLRPPELLQARTDFREKRITAEQLRDVEDQSALKAIEAQQQAGVSVFTEGEYRRAAWLSAIRESVEGFVDVEPPARPVLAPWQGEHGSVANTSTAAATVLAVGARLRQVKRFNAAESAFLKEHSPGPWKITMPGPVSAGQGLYRQGITDKYYPTPQDLTDHIAEMLREEIKALIAEGVSYIQLDSLHYVERIAYPRMRQQMIEDGEDPDQYLDDLIAADNGVLAAAQGSGITIGMHMCRGNNRSAWHAEGSYEPIAEKAFQQLKVDRFLLEYDTERAGNFEPLRFMPKNKMVVLGIISSKEPALESTDDLRRRIDEAAKYVPIENLAISPQCGFASSALGNLLTWDDQRRKLELVAETARLVWA